MNVTRLDEVQLLDRVDELADLLVDTVDGGASVGFLAPMDRAAAVAWWKERAGTVAAGCLAVWAAYDGHRAVGTVSLAFPRQAQLPPPRGAGQADGAPGRARERPRAAAPRHRGGGRPHGGITLLHLDTETDSPAERLYGGAGWTRAGVIPDYAADPAGVLRPTTLYYKRLGATAPTR